MMLHLRRRGRQLEGWVPSRGTQHAKRCGGGERESERARARARERERERDRQRESHSEHSSVRVSIRSIHGWTRSPQPSPAVAAAYTLTPPPDVVKRSVSGLVVQRACVTPTRPSSWLGAPPEVRHLAFGSRSPPNRRTRRTCTGERVGDGHLR